MRGKAIVWLLGALVYLGAMPLSASTAASSMQVGVLAGESGDADRDAVVSGALDNRFAPFDYREARRQGPVFWLRLLPGQAGDVDGVPVLRVRKGRHLALEVFAGGAAAAGLPAATTLPGFRGVEDVAFLLPAEGAALREPLYVRVEAAGAGAEELQLGVTSLETVLQQGRNHARVVAMAFGALLAMSCAALLIFFVLPDRIFLIYATLFSLQALYVTYLSGQGFDWPVLRAALPLMAHAWNVPAALSGAAACLFVREMADLRRYSPREYAVFGWLAIAFVVLAFANAAHVVGWGGWVAALGNVLFLGAALFTVVVAFLAWRRGSRAAGWFLLAWALLEVATTATAATFLFSDAEPSWLHYGLPLAMVAAAVLVALGVADRLLEQRRALTAAERRAETDSLTGVLNRRSVLERLDAACARVQARDLPIALLFIDLDHFKEINDAHGHLAGDACLRAVVAPIQAELRQSDVIGRWGGEEFVVVLTGADANAAHAIAERIVQRVADLTVEGFDRPIRLTCSIGVAASDTLGVWGEHLIARADAAVYDAKGSGRNRVRIAAAATA